VFTNLIYCNLKTEHEKLNLTPNNNNNKLPVPNVPNSPPSSKRSVIGYIVYEAH